MSWLAGVSSGEVRGVGQSCRRKFLPVLPLVEHARSTRQRQSVARLREADMGYGGLSHIETPPVAALLSPRTISQRQMGQSPLRHWMRLHARKMSLKTTAHQSRSEPWIASLPRQAMPGETVSNVWRCLSFGESWQQSCDNTIWHCRPTRTWSAPNARDGRLMGVSLCGSLSERAKGNRSLSSGLSRALATHGQAAARQEGSQIRPARMRPAKCCAS